MKTFFTGLNNGKPAGARRLSALLAALFILQGCAFFNIRKADQATRLAEGEAVIFGKIILSEDGNKLTPYGFFKRPSPTLFHAESGRYSWTVTEVDGSFQWVVPAGSYVIPEVQFGGLFIRPKLGFIAAEPGKAYYLGAVSVDITVVGAASQGVQVNRVAIFDSEAWQRPAPGGPFTDTEKSLVFHDPTLPADLTDREALTESVIFFGVVPKR